MSELASAKSKEIFSPEWNKGLLKKIIGFGVLAISASVLLNFMAGNIELPKPPSIKTR